MWQIVLKEIRFTNGVMWTIVYDFASHFGACAKKIKMYMLLNINDARFNVEFFAEG